MARQSMLVLSELRSSRATLSTMTDPLDAPATKKDLMMLQRRLEHAFGNQLELAARELLREVKNHVNVLASNARRPLLDE